MAEGKRVNKISQRRRELNNVFFSFCGFGVYSPSLRSVLDDYNITEEEFKLLCFLYVDQTSRKGIGFSQLSKISAVLRNEGGLTEQQIFDAVLSLEAKKIITVFGRKKVELNSNATGLINSIFKDFFSLFQHFTNKTFEDFTP